MHTIRPWLRIGKYREALDHDPLARAQVGALCRWRMASRSRDGARWQAVKQQRRPGLAQAPLWLWWRWGDIGPPTPPPRTGSAMLIRASQSRFFYAAFPPITRKVSRSTPSRSSLVRAVAGSSARKRSSSTAACSFWDEAAM